MNDMIKSIIFGSLVGVASLSLIGGAVWYSNALDKTNEANARQELVEYAHETRMECIEAVEIQNQVVEVCLSMYPACTLSFGDAMEDVLRVNAICKRAQDAENRLMEQTVEELVKQLEEITVEADASEVR